jgi:hypothetical protein
MIQGSGSAGFQFKTADVIRFVAGGWTDELKSDITPQPFISCAEDFAHGSRSDFFDHSIMAYDPPSHMQGPPRWHVRAHALCSQ